MGGICRKRELLLLVGQVSSFFFQIMNFVALCSMMLTLASLFLRLSCYLMFRSCCREIERYGILGISCLRGMKKASAFTI